MSRRIAVVGACPYPVPQGSQVLLKESARALAQRGHEVHLVVYGYGLGPDDSGLPIHRCARVPGARRTAAGPSWLKPLLDAALLSTLRRVVREQRIEVIHAHNYEALAVALAAGLRPLVYHAHNAMADELPHYFRNASWARTFGRRLDTNLPRRADQVIAPHQTLAEYLIEAGCAADRVVVIPPPVDAEALTPGAVEEALPPILYTGNLDAYQNLGLLVEAVALVRRDLPQARLIAATGDARHLPGAERIGVKNATDLQAVLAEDCVVACPRVSWSGYPMKMLNAMAAGRPVVACQSAAHGVEHAVTGLIVEDGDAQAFAGALRRLLLDPTLRRTLGANARHTAETRHSLEAIGKRLEEVDDALLH